jgi:hypothetical protein
MCFSSLLLLLLLLLLLVLLVLLQLLQLQLQLAQTSLLLALLPQPSHRLFTTCSCSMRPSESPWLPIQQEAGLFLKYTIISLATPPTHVRVVRVCIKAHEHARLVYGMARTLPHALPFSLSLSNEMRFASLSVTESSYNCTRQFPKHSEYSRGPAPPRSMSMHFRTHSNFGLRETLGSPDPSPPLDTSPDAIARRTRQVALLTGMRTAGWLTANAGWLRRMRGAI